MTQQQLFGDSDGWTDEDFVFVQQHPAEDGFWRDQATQPRFESINIEAADDDTEPDIGEIETADNVEELTLLDAEEYVQFDENELLKSEEIPEISFDEEIEYLKFGGADYEDDTSRPAFPSSKSDTGIAKDLPVDEWLSSLTDLTKKEREEVATWVGGLRPPRFGSWLPWLKDQKWDRRTLLAFLQFQAYWDVNWELWVVRIPTKQRGWIERHYRNTMTRDMALELTKLRLDCAPEDVIDDDWIDQWWDRPLRALLDKKVDSLAVYALHMARWDGVEPWPEYPEMSWNDFWDE